MFNNIPQVTKNLLILNVLMFIGTYILEMREIPVTDLLSLHTFSSPLFKPYQLVTYFFMHGSVLHILFNMMVLVMFGGFLEKLWGAKRFFILYVVSALGAALLYNGISEFQIHELIQSFNAQGSNDYQIINNLVAQGRIGEIDPARLPADLLKYTHKLVDPMLGASGAIFGVTAAFAILFPNTQLQLLFPPIPVKAKYLIGGYFLLEIYLSFQGNEGDGVAHLAHVGGAITGAILVLIWRQKRDKFY